MRLGVKFRVPAFITGMLICSLLHALEETTQESSGEPGKVVSQSADVRLYRTNAERREAGLKRQITPWLTASGLLELDLLREDFRLAGKQDDEVERLSAATVQLDLVAALWEGSKIELVVEYDTETRKGFVEEGILSIENEPWELELGMQYTPFGVFISHFATGPLLEFGETRAPGVTLSYSPDYRLDLALTLYQGLARSQSAGDGRINLAFAVDAWISKQLGLGVSYQTNLADSEAGFLVDEDDRYLEKVPGISGYLVWTTERYEVTFEVLAATRSFLELPSETDQPLAWNAEFVHFLSTDLEWALRAEGSRELEDEPQLQCGAALTWRIQERASLTLEYFHGWFENDFAGNDAGDYYRTVDRVGAQLSITF